MNSVPFSPITYWSSGKKSVLIKPQIILSDDLPIKILFQEEMFRLEMREDVLYEKLENILVDLGDSRSTIGVCFLRRGY